MKKQIFLIVLILFCCFATVVGAEESDEYYIKTAVSLLDLNKPELKAVKDAANAGDYTKAIEEYKEIFFGRAKEYAANGYLPYSSASQSGRADELLENYVYVNDDTGGMKRLYLGENGAWNWIYDEFAWARYGVKMEWINALIDAYLETGEVKYLQKYMDIFEDFDTNFINQYNEYVKESIYLAGEDVRFFRVGQLTCDGRLNRRFYALMRCLRYKPEEIISCYNNVAFAKMLKMTHEDAINLSLGRSTPNLFESAVTGLTRAYVFLQDMPAYIDRYEEAQNELMIHLSENFFTDGGSPEMAFHYNYEFLGFLRNLKAPFELIGVPDWYKNVNKQAIYRTRMLASVLMPDGTNPNLAEDYTAWDVWGPLTKASKGIGGDAVADTIIAKFTENKEKVPSFTSIAFPYVGYYVMRDNWDKDSQYMFLTGSRFGAGHVEMNRLEVKYAAYGERLLGSSPASYSYVDHAKFNNYMWSSVSNNTIRPDGYSQKRTIRMYSDFSMPETGIWHTGNNFDYAEATYDDGYHTFIGTWDERKTFAVTDVSHHRGVIMDKENTLGIVTDNLTSVNEHQYQMAWNFEEKFNSYDTVCVNADEKWIKTCLDDKKVGVELYNIYDGDLSYNVRCGEQTEDEAVGWWLHNYGTDFKPAVHTDTIFSGSDKTCITTLINPTQNGVSKIKNLERTKNSFKAELENGNTVFYQAGKSRNLIKTDNLELSGKSVYIVIRPDKSGYGMLLNASNVKYNGVLKPQLNGNVEFIIENDEIKVVSEMKAPTTFEWKENDKGPAPYYGYDRETRFLYK